MAGKNGGIKFTCYSLPQRRAALEGLAHLCLCQTQPCAPVSSFSLKPASSCTSNLVVIADKDCSFVLFGRPISHGCTPPRSSLTPRGASDFRICRKPTKCRLHVLTVEEHPPNSSRRAFQGFRAPSGPPALVAQVGAGRGAKRPPRALTLCNRVAKPISKRFHSKNKSF